MKKVLLLAFLTGSFAAAFAHKIKIKVSDFQFNAKTVNAVVGDTIIWVWVIGTHTTTSTSIPAGAAVWNKPIDATHKRFNYVLKVAGTYNYRCNFHFSIGMTGKLIVSRALTAGLNSFAVTDDNDAKALLNWKTESSKEIEYFSVQRSTDGDNFKEIARVHPDMLNQYRFTDNNNVTDKYVYYQLEMVDIKGNRQLSEIQMFTQNVKTTKLITSLSPNPVSRLGHLMLQFNADKDGTMLVQLYNETGTLINQAEMTAGKGLNNGHFHLGDIIPGTYYIVCTLGTVKEKHTIIIK
jgi:plastocyanin